MRLPVTLLLLAASLSGNAQDVVALNRANRSLTYEETIAFYRKLDQGSEKAKLITMGPTDSGRLLHLFVLSSDGISDPGRAHALGKAVILINNGIHPGEPDGIDASARLAQAYLDGSLRLPDDVVICIIPVYNIGGALRRGCCSRANQNGPEAYGFRGNARNLDLNRDFVKCDAENTRSFINIFRDWDPDVFVDTHVSDGADYQYTISLISTQHNKLGGHTGALLKNEMTPALFDMMRKRGEEMTPYVNTLRYDDSPENGIYGFLETPRFATGYAALFQTPGFVIETHMLKPFAKRVEGTQKLLACMVEYTAAHVAQIQTARMRDRLELQKAEYLPLTWKSDTTRPETLSFKGYEAVYRTSSVTGLSQLTYDRQKPYTRNIRFFDQYAAADSVKRPDYYFVPQAWKEVLGMLSVNGVQMRQLERDTTFEADTYVIDGYKSPKEPYEGHYLHSEVTVKREVKQVTLLAGDYVVPTRQDAVRYIVETLEPTAPDSWFAWGFFDAILQQKEYFSAYVFDAVALQLLEDNPGLRAQLEQKKSADAAFAADAVQQLLFIYRNSPYAEDLKRYPVSRSR